jgi:hypothetical protein
MEACAVEPAAIDKDTAMNHALRSIIAAGALLACGQAIASGGGAWDPFVNRSAPDSALGRYQSGELGLVLGSYDRLYLYTAWRSVMLGPEELKAAPNPQGGLLRAIGNRNGGWIDGAQGAKVYGAWEAAIAAALQQPPTPAKPGDLLASGYFNCPIASYTFATGTLNDLAKRADATPARLGAWIATQRQVFAFCGDDPAAPRSRYDARRPIPAPAELPADEALYWRQMQQYQLASAAFYDENYALSGSLFARIAATDKHPLRLWGEYLALRSQARAAVYVPASASQAAWDEQQQARKDPAAAAARLAAQQKKLAAIQASVDHILANPELASLHEASRAVARSMQVRLTPGQRFAELSKLLDDPRANPYLEDHLGDWRVLANDLLQQPYGKQVDNRAALRAGAGFVDWMQTVQYCRDDQAQRRCAGEQEHALAQWRHSAQEGNKAQARIWLLASAMLADAMPEDLEKASLQVAPSAPEYLTLRHALARHYRLTGQTARARAIADAALASPQLSAAGSVSARNLFLQERFAVAATPADAANFLLRTHSRALDPDTGELRTGNRQGAEASPAQVSIAADGIRWLNSGLSTADLSELAGNPELAPDLRAQIAAAAWMRFDLLGQGAPALAAAQLLAQTTPELAPVIDKYRKLAGTPERHHWMLVNALKYGLSPMFDGNTAQPALRPADDTLADMWCKMPAKAGAQYQENTDAEYSLPMPELGDTAARDSELTQLAALKTATGTLGDAVMQRATAVPNDAELPWLLYVTVQSTRGGCLDEDSKKLSRSAFTLLHKRYKNNEWAAKTPYFY